MSRIAACFERLKSENKQALIPYLVAGDPVPNITVDVMHAMVASGASIIEIGVPFTDPEAEGPVIQLAHERALEHNVSLRDCIEMVRQFRKQDNETPVLLMGYVNPIEAMGYEAFAKAAGEAGVDASLLVNVPPEEGVLLQQSLDAHSMDSIYLLSPTTTDERAKYICDQARGFIYYVSIKGTTGGAEIDPEEVKQRIDNLKPLCPVPMVVGFGINDGVAAAKVAKFSDGAVVGSAVVKIFEKNQQTPENIAEEVSVLLRSMRMAMDA